MSDEYKESIFMARVAEQGERYEDMYNYIKTALDHREGEYDEEERNLISVAFKNAISTYRNALRNM